MGVNPARGVVFVLGVELKETVGSPPPGTGEPAAEVGKAKVARGIGESVGSGVDEGAARAV